MCTLFRQCPFWYILFTQKRVNASQVVEVQFLSDLNFKVIFSSFYSKTAMGRIENEQSATDNPMTEFSSRYFCHVSNIHSFIVRRPRTEIYTNTDRNVNFVGRVVSPKKVSFTQATRDDAAEIRQIATDIDDKYRRD